MKQETSVFPSPADALPLASYAWGEVPGAVRGIVQIVHGAAEHSARYGRLAASLNAGGYLVYAHDHRGHGLSISAGVPQGEFGAPGWDGLVGDAVAFSRDIALRHPGVPLFLLGHSMGSMAAQELVLENSELYAGLLLSGSTAMDLLAGAILAATPPGAGGGGTDLSAFNAGFEQRTGFEWLSRDAAEVDKYVADPLCGFDLKTDLVGVMAGNVRTADPLVLSGIRSGLPILVVSGMADPLAGGGELVTALADRYGAAGIRDVTLQIYPDARHEIFNETNREEISAFVLSWLENHS